MAGKACKLNGASKTVDYDRLGEKIESSLEAMKGWRNERFFLLALAPGLNSGPAGDIWHQPLRGVSMSATALKHDLLGFAMINHRVFVKRGHR